MSHHDLALLHSFIAKHPVVAAHEVVKLPAAEVAELLLNLESSAAQSLCQRMPAYQLGQSCLHLPQDKLADVLAKTDAHRCATALRGLANDQRERMLSAIDSQLASACRRILRYSSDLVGAYMIISPIALMHDMSVAQSRELYASVSGHIDGCALPVLDQRDRLIAALDVHTLFTEDTRRKVSSIVIQPVPCLSSRTTIQAALEHSVWLQCDTVFVVDHEKRLLGHLRHLDLRRALGHVHQPQRPADSLVSEIGSAYARSLSAILELFDDKKQQASKTERHLPAGSSS